MAFTLDYPLRNRHLGVPADRRIFSEEIDGVDAVREQLIERGPVSPAVDAELWQTEPETRLVAVRALQVYSRSTDPGATVLLLVEHQVGVLTDDIRHEWRLRFEGQIVQRCPVHSYRIIATENLFSGSSDVVETPARYRYPTIAYFQRKARWGEWADEVELLVRG